MAKLTPREHGAYGQLGFPLLTALLVLRPNTPALLLTGAALAAFFAHEPALVAFGRRGLHARESDGKRAALAFVLLLALAAVLGAAGLWLSPRAARIGAIECAVLGALLTGAIVAGYEKTLAGELVAAAAMTSAGFVVALAAGVPWRLATAIWSTWLLGFAAAVFPVRAIVVEHKQRTEAALARIGPTLIVPVAMVLLVAMGEIPRNLAACAVPLFMASLYIALRPPGMKEMKRAGWLLMAAGALTTAALVVTAR